MIIRTTVNVNSPICILWRRT